MTDFSAAIAAYTTPRPDVAVMVPQHAMRVLDVGCSNGAMGQYLKQLKPGRVVHGLERDAALATSAATRLDWTQCVDLETFDWQTLAEESYDCVVFADVLEHLANPLRHLRAACDIVGRGGHVVVSLPNIRHVSALVSIFGKGRFPRNDRGLFDRTHLHWFTLKDGRQLLRDAGFELLREEVSLRAGDKGGGVLNRGLNRLPRWLRHSNPLREFLTYQFCHLGRAIGPPA
jgi:SAM-dependent methyltransferase